MTLYQSLYNFAVDWASKHFKPFTVEDVKKSFHEAKKGQIEEGSPVLGKLVREMSQKGLIFENGFVKVRRPNGKLKVITQWISKEYKAKQSNNRKGDESLTINFEE